LTWHRRLPRPCVVFVLLATLSLAGCGGDDGGPGLDVVPEEQVEQMGVESWQRIVSETPRSDDPQYQEIADRVAGRVLSAAGEDPGAWEVVAFEGEEANAFALPGRKIGVFEGIVRVRADRGSAGRGHRP
jgi:predicted Zn-dependent protease